MNNNRNVRSGLALALVSATVSFITAVFISEFAVKVSTNWMLLIQNLMSLMLTTFLLRKELSFKALSRVKPNLWGLHIIRGIFGLGIYLFYYRSLQLANPTACTLLINTAPLFVVLFSFFFLREHVGIMKLVGVIVGFAGLYLTLMSEIKFTPNHSQTVGVVYALCSGVFFALALITMQKLKKIASATSILLNYSLFATIFMLILLFISKDKITEAGLFACIFIGAVFCIKQYAITLAVGKVSSEVVGMMHYFTIVFLLIYQWLFHHQPLNIILVLGFILIVTGVVFTMRKSLRVPKRVME